MNPRERPGKRGMVFPPSWQGERYTEAEEEAHERLQEAEGERAPTDCPCGRPGVSPCWRMGGDACCPVLFDPAERAA